MHGCIVIAINLTIVLTEIVNFAPNNYFPTFAPNLKKFWLRPWRTHNRIENYCPIAIMNNFSKIFEAMIYSRVSGYFDDSLLLSINQIGCRKNKNAELAIITMIKRVLPALENKSFVMCVFLDFIACFDTINHEVLLNKLYRYGVREVGHASPYKGMVQKPETICTL